MSETTSAERTYSGTTLPGIPILILAVLMALGTIGLIVLAAQAGERGDETKAAWIGIGVVPWVFCTILLIKGLTLIEPNQSRVALLFGKYKGTLRSDGFFWINPFTRNPKISLRAHNFDSSHLKVNDRRGNPIEIGCVVVWRVQDTAQAMFDVEDYQSYVEVQSESALRQLASTHPYDAPADNEVSLRGGHDQINDELQDQLAERLAMAGIQVLEARISHLAYAPEIAGAMLQRQQADAIIDARTRIVDGAVGMVKMALDQMKDQQILELDEERKAAMVSNLLIVLCSERGTQPVVNSGSLY